MSFRSIKALLKKYERLLLPAFLILGLAVDFVTFKTLNIRTAFILLTVHLTVAACAISFVNIFDAKERKSKILGYVRLGAPFILQLTFGALLSASLIFYWFSGAFSVSWPLIVIFAILMASNDILREYYQKPIIQFSVYFFILFSYLTLVLPFLFRSIGEWVFILSGSAALVVIYGFTSLLSQKAPEIKKHRNLTLAISILIFAGMNAAYFLNVIPPLPLSIRDAGVYHDLEHVGSDYVLQEEDYGIIERILPGKTIHVVSGQRVYLFSAIFAPTDLGTVIVHDWEHLENGKWVSRSKPSFAISGGRDAGFRGYSFNSHVDEGKWRVSIETARGQVLGRVRFKVEAVDESPEFVEIVK